MDKLEKEVSDIMHKLDLGLKTYEGRILGFSDEAEVIEIMENCIRDVSDEVFAELLCKQNGPMMTDLLNRARKNTAINRPDTRLADKINRFKTKETEEERQERILKQERDFFFKKDSSVPLCNCGASYTEFPNHHANFCKTNKKQSESYDSDLWAYF